MKAKAITLIFALLTLAGTIDAGPINWVKHHKRFLFTECAAVGASYAFIRADQNCRRGDIERCFGGYGGDKGGLALTTGMSVLVFPAIAEGYWKSNENGKGGYVLGYVFSSYQAFYSIYEFRRYRPELEPRIKPCAVNCAIRFQ